MRFKKGNKVKVKQELLSCLSSPDLIKTLQGIGTIVEIYSKYSNRISSSGIDYHQVRFSNGIWYWMASWDLSLVKNRQLLFDFMES